MWVSHVHGFMYYHVWGPELWTLYARPLPPWNNQIGSVRTVATAMKSITQGKGLKSVPGAWEGDPCIHSGWGWPLWESVMTKSQAHRDVGQGTPAKDIADTKALRQEPVWPVWWEYGISDEECHVVRWRGRQEPESGDPWRLLDDFVYSYNCSE